MYTSICVDVCVFLRLALYWFIKRRRNGAAFEAFCRWQPRFNFSFTLNRKQTPDSPLIYGNHLSEPRSLTGRNMKRWSAQQDLFWEVRVVQKRFFFVSNIWLGKRARGQCRRKQTRSILENRLNRTNSVAVFGDTVEESKQILESTLDENDAQRSVRCCGVALHWQLTFMASMRALLCVAMRYFKTSSTI